MSRPRKGVLVVELTPGFSKLVRRLADDCSLDLLAVVEGCIEAVYYAGSQADTLGLTPYNLAREWLETRDLLNRQICRRVKETRAARGVREGERPSVVDALRAAAPLRLMEAEESSVPPASRARVAQGAAAPARRRPAVAADERRRTA